MSGCSFESDAGGDLRFEIAMAVVVLVQRLHRESDAQNDLLDRLFIHTRLVGAEVLEQILPAAFRHQINVSRRVEDIPQ